MSKVYQVVVPEAVMRNLKRNCEMAKVKIEIKNYNEDYTCSVVSNKEEEIEKVVTNSYLFYSPQLLREGR